MAVEERDVEVEGSPIRYLTAGMGPPLVLLHGASCVLPLYLPHPLKVSVRPNLLSLGR
jgi:hypothetical protein